MNCDTTKLICPLRQELEKRNAALLDEVEELRSQFRGAEDVGQSYAKRWAGSHERIAQLEAALRDYLARADNGDYAYSRRDLDSTAERALRESQR